MTGKRDEQAEKDRAAMEKRRKELMELKAKRDKERLERERTGVDKRTPEQVAQERAELNELEALPEAPKSARIEVAADHYEDDTETLMRIVVMLKDLLHTGGFIVTDAWVAFDYQDAPLADAPEGDTALMVWKVEDGVDVTDLVPDLPPNADEPATDEEDSPTRRKAAVRRR